MKKYVRFVVCFLCVSAFGYSCSKDSSSSSTLDTYDCTGITPTYTNNIKAIFDKNCALSGCHGGGTSEAGVSLSNYSSAKANATNRLLGAIEHKSDYKAMPQGMSKLDDNSIRLINCWIKNGMPE